MAHVLEEEDEAARADVLGQEAGAGEQHGDLAPVARELQLPLDGGGRGAGRVGHAEAGRSRQGGTELRRELAHVGVGLAREHLRSEEHTSELQSLAYLVCRLLLEKKKQ